MQHLAACNLLAQAGVGVQAQGASSGAGELLRNPFEVVITKEQAATVALLFLPPEPFEEPLVGRLASQVVAIENCAPDAPEVFHGGHLPSEVEHTVYKHTPLFVLYKVIFTKYSNKAL